MNITCRPVLFLMTYGKRLDEALAHAGKSRKALADVLGCTPQAIGIVINWAGEKDRKLETEAHARCAKFLKVDHYWLATGEGEMISETNHATAPVDTAQAAMNNVAQSNEAVMLGTMLDTIKDPMRRLEVMSACVNLIVLAAPQPAPKSVPTPLDAAKTSDAKSHT